MEPNAAALLFIYCFIQRLLPGKPQCSAPKLTVGRKLELEDRGASVCSLLSFAFGENAIKVGVTGEGDGDLESGKGGSITNCRAERNRRRKESLYKRESSSLNTTIIAIMATPFALLK